MIPSNELGKEKGPPTLIERLAKDLENLGVKTEFQHPHESGLSMELRHSTKGQKLSIHIHELTGNFSKLLANQSGLCLEFYEANLTIVEYSGNQKKYDQHEIVFEVKEQGLFLVRNRFQEKEQENRRTSDLSELITTKPFSFGNVHLKAAKVIRELDNASNMVESSAIFNNFELKFQRFKGEAIFESFINLELKADRVTVNGDIVKLLGEINQDLSDISSFKIFTIDKRNSVSIKTFAFSQGLSIPSIDLSLTIDEVIINCKLRDLYFNIKKTRVNINYSPDKSGIFDYKQEFFAQQVESLVKRLPVMAIDNLTIHQSTKDHSIEAKMMTLDLTKISSYSQSNCPASRASNHF